MTEGLVVVLVVKLATHRVDAERIGQAHFRVYL